MARRPSHFVLRLADKLEARGVKIALAALIIISVLPIRGIDDTLRPYFLLIFGVELALRAVLLRRKGQENPRLERMLFALDLIAFSSFLPFERILHAEALVALPLLRLSRLLLLLRFARELALDVYSIMTRREQLHQFGLVTSAVLALAFGSAVLLHHLGVPYDYDGNGVPVNPSFGDRIWWSFRQLEDAGNLVQSLRVHPVVAFLSLALTIVGVFVISFIIGIGTNIVDQVVHAERRRKVGYKGHALVIGAVHEAEMLVREFVGLYERNRTLRRIRPGEVYKWLFRGGPPPRRHALPRMVLLGTEPEPPPYLYEPMMRWVVYRHGDGAAPKALERAGAAVARRVVLLARPEAGPDADAVTAMALTSLRALNPEAQVFVEVCESYNRELMQTVGGPGTYALDMPRFLGLFLCQHLITPGIEEIYTDLMTADGSEFYTHIFVEPKQIPALAELAEKDGCISFAEMSRAAYQERQVLLTGVFLGEQTPREATGLVPVDGLVQWLNPLRDPPEGSAAWAMGARAGRVPMDKLRGLIGVSTTYAPLRRYGHDLVLGEGLSRMGKDETTRTRAWASELELAQGELSRVLVVGYSATLPALLKELARFVPNVEVVLVVGARGDERLQLEDKLASLGLGLEAGVVPGAEGATASLPHGGRARVFTQQGPDLASFAVRAAAGCGPVGAAVFLSEIDAMDSDARTAMRLLRFVRALEKRELAHGGRLHIVAELASVEKGEHVRRLIDAKRCGFADPSQLRISLISTERIKNYFMVHSAFVPGVVTLYDEILSEEGQELIRLEPGDKGRGELDFEALREALAERQIIPVALELDDGSMALNPEPDERFAMSQIRAVFALAESRDLESPEMKKAREAA